MNIKNSIKFPRVTFLVGEFPDDIGSFVMDQIDELSKLGLNVKIVALRKSSKPQASQILKDYKYIKNLKFIGVPRNIFFRYIKGLGLFFINLFRHPTAIINSLNPLIYGKVAFTLIPFYTSTYFLNHYEKLDILHAHFGQRGIYGAAVKNSGIKTKLITSFYGGDLSYFIEHTSKKIYSPLVEEGDLFLPLSDNFRQKLIELGCNKKKIITHRVGIDLKKFKYLDRKNSDIFKILMIARFVEKKGHRYLIEAISKVIKKNKKVSLTLVGDGPLKNEIIQLVYEKGLENYVKFICSIPNSRLPEFYYNSDLYVLPSVTASDGDKEGTPVSLIEAQSTGLPILSTIHSGIPEAVLNYKSGFLVNEKDSEAIYEKIMRLIGDIKLRKKFGKRGNIFVAQNYDKEKQAKKLLNLYRELVKN